MFDESRKSATQESEDFVTCLIHDMARDIATPELEAKLIKKSTSCMVNIVGQSSP